MIQIYKYIYIPSKTDGLFSRADHREIIDQYSEQGWRFVTAIPTDSGSYGQIKAFDLVFEKEEMIDKEK